MSLYFFLFAYSLAALVNVIEKAFKLFRTMCTIENRANMDEVYKSVNIVMLRKRFNVSSIFFDNPFEHTCYFR